MPFSCPAKDIFAKMAIKYIYIYGAITLDFRLDSMGERVILSVVETELQK